MARNIKHAGKNKLKYVNYRCCNRDLKNLVQKKEIRREYIEDFVLEELQRKVFSKRIIEILSQAV